MARRSAYVGLLYQDLIKGGQIKGRRLPPVLPIVFYTGEERWSAATDIAELLPQDPPEPLAKYLPRDLRPELDVPEAHDLGEITMQLAERFKQ